jgi:hypothetical protein
MIDRILIETESSSDGTDRQIQAVSSQDLKQNLNQLIALVKQLGQDSAGDLELDEVSVTVKVMPEGKVVLSDRTGSGGITLNFKRSQPREKLPELSTVSSILPIPSINYSDLENLLAAHKWQEASQETGNLLCRALQRSPNSHLSVADINLLPCQALSTIDRLWQKYSQGRFGFSIQKQVFDASS